MIRLWLILISQQKDISFSTFILRKHTQRLKLIESEVSQRLHRQKSFRTSVFTSTRRMKIRGLFGKYREI